MKDMFYNYEHNIDRKDYPEFPPCEFPRQPEGHYGAEPVFNAHGDCLGVKAKADSKFDLFFSFEGEIEGSDIYSFLSEGYFILGLYSSKSKLVASFTGEKFDDNNLVVHIDSSELPCDIYSMMLIATYKENTYTLFNEGDGILHII